MNTRAESEAATEETPISAVFTECDRVGCILWQSARANRVLGARAGLADALTAGAARWSVTCVLDTPRRIWLGLQPLPKPESAAHRSVGRVPMNLQRATDLHRRVLAERGPRGR